jgi:hypothetical protein
MAEWWYGDRKYVDYLRLTPNYSVPPATSLYPGHAAYSGIELPSVQPISPTQDKYETLPEENSSGWLTSDITGSGSRGSDTIDDLLASKLEGLHQNIQHIQYQLDNREKLKKQNIYDIDKEMMKSKTELFECENWMPGSNSLIERRRTDLKKQLQQMQKEKRLEQVASWRDQQRLLKDLRDIVDDYRNAFRRKSLVSGSYGPFDSTAGSG